MASLTADVLNCIVYRYLQESGFTHSAFNFRFEAGTDKFPFDVNLVPPTALVTIVQLGLQYKEMEANAENDVDMDFCVLQPMDLITKDIAELKKLVKGKGKGKLNVAGGKDLGKGKQVSSSHVKGKPTEDPKKKGVLILGDDGVRRRSKRLKKVHWG
ncbi:F-box-like/WD repeat-containing protein TBL1XR1 [Striga asiatica]|uniref:F-box-like/WD repeat-containing protein TBL1XR1 n=1 Tax=Striga asiatica TaxID=4170 RepID=A0A5A7PDU0_STRAF|nr:F-box-like/WD repeat-containing protein TBL1XR1 [Striga asiatica]